MDPRILDTVSGIIALIVFIVLLLILPRYLGNSFGFLLAIIVFIGIMSAMGYLIKDTIK
jgi:uncharacterized membrane protein YccC